MNHRCHLCRVKEGKRTCRTCKCKTCPDCFLWFARVCVHCSPAYRLFAPKYWGALRNRRIEP